MEPERFIDPRTTSVTKRLAPSRLRDRAPWLMQLAQYIETLPNDDPYLAQFDALPPRVWGETVYEMAHEPTDFANPSAFFADTIELVVALNITSKGAC